jgi:hypothetical protein
MSTKKHPPITPTKPGFIHQIDSTRRQHRIIIIHSGRPDNGPWFDLPHTAFYKGLLASTVETGGLPEGIFTVSRKAYEVLS